MSAKVKWILGLLLIMVMACGEELQQEFTAEITIEDGGSIVLPDRQTLSLQEVSDSRCPANANCTWEGRADVQLALMGSEVDSLGISLNDVERKTVTSGIYRVEFLGLTPFPGTSEDQNGVEKTLKLRITRSN